MPDPLTFLYAAIASFVPAGQNLSQLSHSQRLQVHVLNVDLHLVAQLTDLIVHLIQVLAHLIDRLRVAQRSGHLGEHSGGRVFRAAKVVALCVETKEEWYARLAPKIGRFLG